MSALSPEAKNTIVEYLRKQIEAYAVILFGSAAEERLRDDSDVDVAFLSDQTFHPYDLFMAAGDLASSLRREVDLVDFRKASTVFQAQIVENGVLLFDERTVDRQYAFMRALKEYALLNEERYLISTKIDLMNKTETLQRCIRRIKEEYEGKAENLQYYTKRDSIILNLQRASEACIDLAMHMVSERKLGLPQNSHDAFELLHKERILDDDITQRMKMMVGFRNIAVHDDQAVQVPILQSILDHHLDDFQAYIDRIKA